MMKVCSRCKKTLPEDSFRWKNFKTNTRQAYCIKCNSEYNKEHYQKNKSVYAEKNKARDKIHEKVRRYNLSRSEYEHMLASQGSKCKICKIKPATHIDHDHATQKVRGILCRECNLGLGYFYDNPSFLKAAIKYL
jgi:Recombination endonuclease VII